MKLTEAQVREIRQTYTGKGKRGRPGPDAPPRPTLAKLAEQYGVSITTVHDAYTGRRWSHVEQ